MKELLVNGVSFTKVLQEGVGQRSGGIKVGVREAIHELEEVQDLGVHSQVSGQTLRLAIDLHAIADGLTKFLQARNGEGDHNARLVQLRRLALHIFLNHWERGTSHRDQSNDVRISLLLIHSCVGRGPLLLGLFASAKEKREERRERKDRKRRKG